MDKLKYQPIRDLSGEIYSSTINGDKMLIFNANNTSINKYFNKDTLFAINLTDLGIYYYGFSGKWRRWKFAYTKLGLSII